VQLRGSAWQASGQAAHMCSWHLKSCAALGAAARGPLRQPLALAGADRLQRGQRMPKEAAGPRSPAGKCAVPAVEPLRRRRTAVLARPRVK
jgi:hypothetical protein